MRHELKLLRVKHNLTQKELADKLGVSVATYNLIEKGNSNGTLDFWKKIKKEFNLTGEETWNIQNGVI